MVTSGQTLAGISVFIAVTLINRHQMVIRATKFTNNNRLFGVDMKNLAKVAKFSESRILELDDISYPPRGIVDPLTM